MPRKRRHKAGNLADLQRVLWGLILEVEALLGNDPPADRVLRCAHAMAQLSGAYKGILEVNIEARLQALESASNAKRNGTS
jgi:hypothetical protein